MGLRDAALLRVGASRPGPYMGRRVVLGTVLTGIGVLPSIAQSPLRLLALGDSLTAGFGLPQDEGFVPQLQAALQAAGRPVKVLNAGVSGDTTAGGLARLDWALADHPQAAIVALGGNDGLRALPPAASKANLAAILDRLAAANIPVLLAGMLAPPNLGAAYGREFAAIYAELAAARPAVVFYPFFLEGVAGDPALNQPDGIHPNQRGVAEMVRRILPAVAQLLDRVPPPA
ncbi:arylesterase [Siccirubricoccus phaeus]|uniref:arylesterase n=1 Tax=Siccirubricoccus phaeus TaxID=2595053 RepID=UPI0038B4BE03